MINRQNLIGILLTVAFITIALVLESALDSIQDYSATTFDIASGIWWQLGLALLFGFLIVAFFQVVVVHMKPDRWVHYVQLAIAIVALLPIVFTYLTPLDITGIPLSIRGPFISNPPSSYFGIATMVVLWVGASGLLRPRR